MPEYSKETLWKLYERLPQELKEAIFSNDTAEAIHQASETYEIEEDKIPELAKLTGRVLLGLLPLEDFQETLEQELEIEKEAAGRVAHEINRFVFFPVKESLVSLYAPKKEVAPATEVPFKRTTERPVEPTPETKKATSKTESTVKAKKTESPRKSRADAYRESIE